MYTPFAQILIGPSGKYWPEYGTLDTLWCRGIHADYYRTRKYASPESCLRYCNGNAQYPRRLRNHYLQPKGLQMLRSNMLTVVNASTSLRRVQKIQEEIHNWICKLGLSTPEHLQIESNYVAKTTDRHQIAIYLADIMYYVIVRS